MYENLRIALFKANVSNRTLANELKLHENTVLNKLSGKTDFTVEEAFKIKKKFFPTESLEEIFAE